MQIRPILNNVVIKPISEEKLSQSGIIIPDTIDKEPTGRGEIVSISARLNFEIAVGQIILFKKYSSDKVEIDGEEFLIIKAEDIMAILE